MTETPLRLMAILAHPDDEALGFGGTLARYAAAGVETFLVTATRGERGWFGAPDLYPGPNALGQLREVELRRSAGILGIRQIDLLGYLDGDLDQADPVEAVARIVACLRRARPQVVVTFGLDGTYGHPDHIAISQLTSAALVAAADPGYAPETGSAHRVAKLYHFAARKRLLDLYEQIFGELVMEIDGVERRTVAVPDWMIAADINSAACWRQVWEAVRCHETQLPGLAGLLSLPDDVHERLWGEQTFTRVFSLVNGGREIERDLFAGLR
jgi:LmbE family N-acetylglucosaminyl deacetylase